MHLDLIILDYNLTRRFKYKIKYDKKYVYINTNNVAVTIVFTPSITSPLKKKKYGLQNAFEIQINDLFSKKKRTEKNHCIIQPGRFYVLRMKSINLQKTRRFSRKRYKTRRRVE